MANFSANICTVNCHMDRTPLSIAPKTSPYEIALRAKHPLWAARVGAKDVSEAHITYFMTFSIQSR